MPIIRHPFRIGPLISVLALLSGSIAVSSMSPAAAAAGVPRPDHVVVVVMENHSNTDVIGNSAAPYINQLAATGANFSQSYAITHPSQPNYLALFSGSQQAVTDNSCPHSFSAANLGSELIANNLSFNGYSESMPYDGYTGCTSGTYARKHSPWVNFTNIPASSNLTLDAFPTDYSQLPTVSFVTPNLDNDMHDGTVAQGDTWLKTHFDSYVQWAKTHNSLLVLTFDEDDNSAGNRIPTIFVGASVTPGTYSEHIDHYDVLRTLEDAYDLPYAGASASATPITDIWASTPPPPPVPTGCTAAQLILNPGFETGTASPWTGSTDIVVHETPDQQAWGGNWMAWFGGKGVAQTDTLSQTVSIPAGCNTASLNFRLHIDTAERTKRNAYDTFKVMLQSPPSGSVPPTATRRTPLMCRHMPASK
jgi:phosphatidylinositol-3-phosphatase